MKQSIDVCLREYSTEELIQFHANLNALFIGCTEDFHVFPLLLQVHFTLGQRTEPIAQKYLQAVENMLNVPPEYKYKKT